MKKITKEMVQALQAVLAKGLHPHFKFEEVNGLLIALGRLEDVVAPSAREAGKPVEAPAGLEDKGITDA